MVLWDQVFLALSSFTWEFFQHQERPFWKDKIFFECYECSHDFFSPKVMQTWESVCWTRCFDVSKSKRKAWRPCCCVCVLSSCLKLVNSLLKMIQVHLNLEPFEKMSFLKCCWRLFFETTGCFTLTVFEKVLKSLTFLSSQFNRLFRQHNRLFSWKTLTKFC